MSITSVKEQLAQALNTLSEAELEQVAEYVAFLRFRASVMPPRVIGTTQLATLYDEFADEAINSVSLDITRLIRRLGSVSRPTMLAIERYVLFTPRIA